MAKVEVKFVEIAFPVESVTLVLDAEEADLVREALLHKYASLSTAHGSSRGAGRLAHRASLSRILTDMRGPLPDSALDASKRVSARF